MNLTGMDLKVIPGIIMVYTLAPPNRPVVREQLTDADIEILDRLDNRMSVACNALYELISTASSRADVIRERLALEMEWVFTDRERTLLVKLLETCAQEMDHGGDVAIHFGGAEYGVSAHHLRDLKARLVVSST